MEIHVYVQYIDIYSINLDIAEKNKNTNDIINNNKIIWKKQKKNIDK